MCYTFRLSVINYIRMSSDGSFEIVICDYFALEFSMYIAFEERHMCPLARSTWQTSLPNINMFQTVL